MLSVGEPGGGNIENSVVLRLHMWKDVELEPEIIELPRWWSHTQLWGYNWNMGIQMNYCSSRGPQERSRSRKAHALPGNSHVLLIKGDQHTAEAIASDEKQAGRIVRWGKGGAWKKFKGALLKIGQVQGDVSLASPESWISVNQSRQWIFSLRFSPGPMQSRA